MSAMARSSSTSESRLRMRISRSCSGIAATYADWDCVWSLASRQVYVNLVRARLLESPPAHSLDLRWLY